MSELIIKVTKNDIEKGYIENSCDNPIALSIKRYLTPYIISCRVYDNHIDLIDFNYHLSTIKTPSKCKKFILLALAGFNMRPFKFKFTY